MGFAVADEKQQVLTLVPFVSCQYLGACPLTLVASISGWLEALIKDLFCHPEEPQATKDLTKRHVLLANVYWR